MAGKKKVYLSTWLLAYGDYQVIQNHNLDQVHDHIRLTYGREYPGIAVIPSLLNGGKVSVGMPTDMPILREPSYNGTEAFGLFWLAGTFDGTPGEFLRKHVATFDTPTQIIFDGTARYQDDGKVVFKGRAEKPFSDLRRAVFMLVKEQLDENDVIQNPWRFHPVEVI